MNELFKDIMEIHQVQGIIYFSFDGSILFQYYKQEKPQELAGWDISHFITALNNVKEAELVFDNIMLYIIRGRSGFLLAVLDRSAPVALVRLNCNILLATLDKGSQKPKGLTRFLKRQP